MISYDKKYGDLQLLMVLGEEGEKYKGKLDFLFKALNKPFKPFGALDDPIYRKWPYSSFLSLYDALNGISYGYETKKQTCALILDRFVDSSTYYDRVFDRSLDIWLEAKQKIKHVKQEIEKMKNLDKFLVELTGYDKEAEEKFTGEREFAFIYNVPEDKKLTPKEIVDTINHSFVNAKNDYDVIHDILTVKGNNYKVSSGHTEFTGDRWNTLSNDGAKDPIIDIDYDRAHICKVTNIGNIIRPHLCNLQNIVDYYQKKNPSKKIDSPSLFKKPEKKKVKEEEKDTHYYWNLAKERANESKKERYEPSGPECYKKFDAKESDKKVCILNTKTGRIFRERKSVANKLVNSQKETFEYCQKKFWKRQQYKLTKKGEKIIISSPSYWDHSKKKYVLPITTNINPSMYGRRLGEREQRRILRQQELNAKMLANQQGHRIQLQTQKIYIPGGPIEEAQRRALDSLGEYIYSYKYKPKGEYKTLIHRKPKKRIPGDVERNVRSAKDSANYQHSLKDKDKTNKNPRRHRTHRAWEYELTLVDKKVKGFVKAMTEQEAKDKLQKVVTQCKVISYRLTGRVDIWVRATGKQRQDILNKKKS
jgi:hypothetical protein